jgi:hypothetical protein
MEKGTSSGVVSDENGNYSIGVSGANAVLVFSYVGLRTVEVAVGKQTTVDVAMESDYTTFSDVVVTASRQAVRKLETTTAVEIIGSKQLQRSKPEGILEAITSAPGVFTNTSQGRRGFVVTRGFPDGSPTGGLVYTGIMLDGIPTLGTPGKAPEAGFGFDLNVERVEVVRGSAATIFGRASAAGVVNVITRTGGEKLGGTVRLTSYNDIIGTGNFNERTARFYTDISLFTANQEVADDVANVFDFIRHTYRRHKFRHLAVSPLTNRSLFLRLIHTETLNARAGRRAEIFIKCNNLVDEQIIARLYEASESGVRIRAIVRGMCSLVAGVPGESSNIEVISIVDRFLEHSRIYIFHNDGETRYLMSSADLMTRNLDHRVEVTAPIYDPDAKARVQRLMDTQWADNVKARVLTGQQENEYRPRGTRKRFRSQEVLAKLYAEDEKDDG